jgi:protein-S-isoprenylcysteine O-methyltransferase Ste14
MRLKYISVLGYVIIVMAFVTLISRESILATGIPGIAVQILSILLMIWARATFGGRSFHAAADPTEGGLVTTGPYQYIRHPIYAAALYFMWAGIFSHMSITNLGVGLFGTAGVVVRIIAEETLVQKRYPEYAAYAEKTKRIIPFII